MSDVVAKVITPEFRVSYPNVFQASKNELNGNMEYSMVAIFPKDADLSALRKAAKEASAKRWGPDESKWPENIRSPFRKCKERWKIENGKQVIPPGYEDGEAVFITMKAYEDNKPGIVDQNVQDIIEPRMFYAGCYARASVKAKAYPSPKATGPATANKGIRIELVNVQKTREGEPLAGNSRPTDDFQPVEGAGASGGQGAKGVFDD